MDARRAAPKPPCRPLDHVRLRAGTSVPVACAGRCGAQLAPAGGQARRRLRPRRAQRTGSRSAQSHTSPRKKDTDGDGLRDKYELRALAHQPAQEGHRPRRPLRRVRGERLEDRAPRRSDSDGDGLSDGYEVKRSKTSPRRKDTDRDGLSDGYEVKVSKTSPRMADDDGDGLKDGVEVLFGLDPNAGPGDDVGAGPPTRAARRPPTRRRRRADPPEDPDDTDHAAPNTSLTPAAPRARAPRARRPSRSARRSPARASSAGSTAACGTRAPRPKGFSSLGEGGHTFYVRARDAAGNDGRVAGARDLDDRPSAAPRPHPAEHVARLGRSERHRDHRVGELLVLVLGVGLELPVQARRRRAGAGARRPRRYSGLSEASHNFYVRARDDAAATST